MSSKAQSQAGYFILIRGKNPDFFGIPMFCTICTLLLFLSGACPLAFNHHLEPRHYVYGIFLTLTAVIFSGLTILILKIDPPNYPTLGVFWGSFIVALGWITTNEISIRNSRKQHTVNLITAYFTNAQLIKDRETIQDTFPSYDDKVTTDTLDFRSSTPLNRAIVRELNYYEFLAAALHRHDLNEQLLRDCLGEIVVNVYLQMEEYIKYWRCENSQTWACLDKLYRDWSSLDRPTPKKSLQTGNHQ